MQTYAHIRNGIVIEVLPLDDDQVIGEDLHTPEIAAACVRCDATVREGWTFDGKVFAEPPPPVVTVADLVAYAAAKRFTVEVGGIGVAGLKVATDRESQTMIANAFAYVAASGAASVRFKAASGWTELSAERVKALAVAVGAHVQAAFAVEDDLDAAINASPPTVTTLAEVDAAPWPANA